MTLQHVCLLHLCNDIKHNNEDCFCDVMISIYIQATNCEVGLLLNCLPIHCTLNCRGYQHILLLGNAGSAFIEILAGNSLWPFGKEYATLLASTMLMSPGDSKTGRNKEGVKMFDKGKDPCSSSTLVG